FDLPMDLQFDSEGPQPSQFVLLTASDGGGRNGKIKHILEDGLENRQEYCDAQGYICHWVNISRFDWPEAPPVWKKLPAIVETFQTYPDVQWVWMLDLDAIIMSPEVDVTKELLSHGAMEKILLRDEEVNLLELNEDNVYKEFIHSAEPLQQKATPSAFDPRSIDLIVAQASNGINAGSFLIRRSEWSRLLLDLWRDVAFLRAGFMYEEQTTLLHFLQHHSDMWPHVGFVPLRTIQARVGDGEYGWQPGDLAVHFPGCSKTHQCQELWDEMWAKRGRAFPVVESG
ncbi:glycosyltransferase family 34 protein, partial [Aulographum hederae CBS 113979]